MSAKAPGFSLLEVMVAMIITGTAIAVAAALLLALADRTSGLQAVGERADREANVERLLVSLARNLDAGPDRDRRLVGEPHRAWFSTWCAGREGRPEECTVQLLIRATESGMDVRAVIASASSGDSIALDLWTGLSTARLLYLVDSEGRARWADQWTIAPFPVAFGLVLDQDTLVFPTVAGG